MMVVTVAFGVDEVCYFSMYDIPEGPPNPNDPTAFYYYYGVQYNTEPNFAFTPKPGYYTLKLMGTC